MHVEFSCQAEQVRETIFCGLCEVSMDRLELVPVPEHAYAVDITLLLSINRALVQAREGVKS